MKDLSKRIKMALKHEKCDLVLKNATYINVFNQKLEKGDIGICDDTIVGIGNYEGHIEIDCNDRVVSPGFIDSHVHIESTMITPEKYSDIALKNGVTTIIADPHEIANVQGMKGIEFMIKSSKSSILDILFMLPSCVPATMFEDNGDTLTHKELKELVGKEKVLGLGEVMDVPAVLNCDEEMIKKLLLFKDGHIDGHCPKIDEVSLNGYLIAGIKTDHECSAAEEALEKIKKGMYVMMREGSAAKNLSSLLKAVNNENFHRFLFCTDDRHLEDLIEEGSINHCLRVAMRDGLEPAKAFTMATFNAAQCFDLKDRGAIAPGYKADLVIIENIKKVDIVKIIKDGKDINHIKKQRNKSVTIKNSINMNFVSEDNFKIMCIKDKVNVIKCNPQSLETKKVVREVIIDDGYIKGFKGKDILKLGVFERHKRTGKFSVGLVEGLGLKNCSIAQSIAHDSHNIIVVGDKDKDMTVAVNSLITIGGGIAIVSEENLIAHLSLPIGGIMTFQDPYIVAENIKRLNRIARSFGLKAEYDPFITLSFLALPVIPEIKLTARGLFDYNRFEFIDL
jgi:adenine deaminase